MTKTVLFKKHMDNFDKNSKFGLSDLVKIQIWLVRFDQNSNLLFFKFAKFEICPHLKSKIPKKSSNSPLKCGQNFTF